MKKTKNWRHFSIMSALILSLAFAFTITGCFDDFDYDYDDYGNDYNQDSSDSDPPSDSVQFPERAEGTDTGQRPYRVSPLGGGEDRVTLMLYLCGSDLESEGGAATNDLYEIMRADISENLNIVVETGGANEWQNSFVDPSTNERWLITNDGMLFLENSGPKDMSEGRTLTDFIKFAALNFPADRYMLVLWDHGGGTVDGYAYDERFGKYDMMPISELNRALSDAGVVFDMIGFDCCLMSTVETAFLLERYADYMVASQRIEPGEGWHYTPWIEALSKNTSIPTLELGKIIVDSFIAESRGGYYGNELTLSVTDLTYIEGLFGTMVDFFADAQETLVYDNTFIEASQLLGSSRSITDNYDLVDLAYLVANMDSSEELLAKIGQCVAYNGTTIDQHYGLCLYFPYSDLRKVNDALDIFNQLGIDDAYRGFITAFANIMVGGQAYNSGGSGNPLGGDDYDFGYWSGLDWVDADTFGGYSDFYSQYSYDDSELEIYEKDGEYVLSLTDMEWEIITAIAQYVYLDDGEGYIELGADSMYEFNEDGDLLISFDNTWVALDGQLVCFYTSEEVFGDGYWYTYGNVPILYDGEYAELVLVWDSNNPYGYVAGWRYTATGSGSQRGLFDVKNGMTFYFLCEYYTYDGEYDDEYLWGSLTVNGEIEVSYEDVGDGDCVVFYVLYDIYCNTYWTESVVYSLYW